MGIPHKHAAIIKAWADGATIQFRRSPCVWETFHPKEQPHWLSNVEYRVKPEPKKTPGQMYWEAAHPGNHGVVPEHAVRGVRAVIEAYKRGEFDES